MFRQAPSFPYHDLGIVEDGNTASRAISKDAYVIWKGASYFASTDILQGATLEEDVNLTAIPDGVINGVVEALNNKINPYSTSEIECGTWIDGKTIYRRVFNVGAVVDNTNTDIDSGITNIDTVVRLSGSFKRSGFLYLIYDLSSNYFGEINVNTTTGHIVLRSGSSTVTFNSGVLIFEYTKNS